MIIVLKPGATREQAEALMSRIASEGLRPLYLPGEERVVLGAIGDERLLARLRIESDPVVETVKPILAPYKLVAREMHPADTVVHLGEAAIGGQRFTVIGGPCAVESREQIRTTAAEVKKAGAAVLRGGAFKPRTSPYSFQGLGEEGLRLLREAADWVGLPCVTEVMDPEEIRLAERHADALQIGARNMQNFRLLQAVGRSTMPVILKRGLAARVDDLLLAAEYIVGEGNPRVILCERGITTFETATRNTLDLSAIPLLKQRSHLPVLVDPSHATGLRELVPAMALAALACGADGLLVEVHPDPPSALSDGRQSLYPAQFAETMSRLASMAAALGRSL
jgi:3-deoxy-7-phosphoheptulonate synthase